MTTPKTDCEDLASVLRAVADKGLGRRAHRSKVALYIERLQYNDK